MFSLSSYPVPRCPVRLQELVVQISHVHKGYVSECTWFRGAKMTAHILFMLSEEAVAAVLAMFMVNNLAAGRYSFDTPCATCHPKSGLAPTLVLRAGIASSGCDYMCPDETTGRLV
jgi:hypothetical protein